MSVPGGLQTHMAPKFEDYSEKYSCLKMERHDGILLAQLHTDGGPLKWSSRVHEELGWAATDIGADRENHVMILTGTGDAFCNDIDGASFGQVKNNAQAWDLIDFDGKRLVNNMLALEIPVIAAVNGPLLIHAEVALLSDIVICSEDATFQDLPHFISDLAPGDGVHVMWQQLLGPNRARYFLITGEILSAQQALDLGVVGEVRPRDQLMDRAWEIARMINERSVLTRRMTRRILTHETKRQMHNYLDLGLALEGLACVDHWPE